jgi:hypothetical protein
VCIGNARPDLSPFRVPPKNSGVTREFLDHVPRGLVAHLSDEHFTCPQFGAGARRPVQERAGQSGHTGDE